MGIAVWLCVLGGLASETVAADSGQVERGPAPRWVVESEAMPVPAAADGAAFIRRQDTEVHLDGRGQAIFSGYRIRILHPSALQVGNVSVVWNPTAGRPVIHALKIYRDNDVIDVLRNANFEVLRREDQLEAAQLNGILTAVLRVPDLRVGDELEFAATIPSSDPTLGSQDAGILGLGPQPAPGRYHMRLSWAEGSRPAIKPSPDLRTLVRQSPDAIDVRFDNPAILSAPKDAPPRYAWQRVMEFSRVADWKDVSSRFAPLYMTASKLKPDSALRREVARIESSAVQPFDRAAAALKLVQQDVRYVYVGLSTGNLTPATADETWQRRYGDCKAKTVLLLALLRELGIEAQAVLVNNTGADDGLDERLPSPRLFDHVLVRARVNGKNYWLDGTLPAAVPLLEAPIMPYRWVLPLSGQGNGLEHLAWKPAERPDEVTLHEIDARQGFEKPATIVSTTIKRGIEGVEQVVQISALASGQLLDVFRQNAIGDTWQAIDDVQWRYDVKAQASILTVVGRGTVNWDNSGGTKSLALPGGGFYPPEKRVRPADQNQDAPYYNKPNYSCHVTTLRLPMTTQSRQWSHKDDIDTRIFGRSYHRAFDLRDGTLRMVRGSRTEEVEVDAASARQDNDRIAGFDNSMAWVTYNPAGNTAHGRRTEPVPATYEIDWTADNVPCLAPTPKTK